MTELFDAADLETAKNQIVATMKEYFACKEVNVFCVTRGMEINQLTNRAIEQLLQDHVLDMRVVGKRTGGTQKLYKLKPTY